MPYYDYVCGNCGNEIEVMHSVHADGPVSCAKCGGPMKKTFAVPAVHFKGSGWARKEKSTSPKPGRSEAKDAVGQARSGSSDSSSGTPSGGGASAEPSPAPAAEAVSKEPD